MMIEHYLQTLKQVWASEPRRHSPRLFICPPSSGSAF